MINNETIKYEIWTNKLSKTYGKGEKAVKAVKQIDITVEPGIYGFLGPNGAGKTSTIHMLIGAISITSGKAKIRGMNAGSVNSRRIIGFLPQDPSFYKNMTGKQYLLYMAQLNGLKKMVARQKIEELLGFFDLMDAKERKIGKYSGGMKQKIGIAASLIHDPEILILDEPTSNLDPIARAEIINRIKKLSENISVFVSSHILSEIEQMCEKVVMINKGKIILIDTIKNIKDIYKASSNTFILSTDLNEKMIQILKVKDYIANIWLNEKENKIYIKPSNNNAFLSEIPKLLAENNVMLKSLNQQESTLQDIFVDIIGEDDKNEFKKK
ncbi:MAG: ABC transporter ATP-binding protein [Promethearchaeota archaeon]